MSVKAAGSVQMLQHLLAAAGQDAIIACEGMDPFFSRIRGLSDEQIRAQVDGF